MQKWEYLYLEAEDDKVRWINGQVLVSREQKHIKEYLDELGKDGWELVGICPASERAIYWRLVLKRPK